MSTNDENASSPSERPAPKRRAVKRTEDAAKSDALRQAFGSQARPEPRQAGASSARSRATSARRTVAGPTAQAPASSGKSTDAKVEHAVSDSSASEETSRSDRLVSEAVMAGLDAMAGASVRVPVGAGGGGGLPSRPVSGGSGSRTIEERPVVPAVVPGEDADGYTTVAIPPRQDKDHPLVAFGHVMDSFISECGELTIMGGQVLKSAIVHPRGYWGDVKDQIYDALKLCWVPMIFAVAGFGFGAPGLQGGNILTLFGVPDRIGGFMMFATIREFGPFVEAMVVAGVIGTAITADLGARRIREEIDAMEVLGVDPIRKLIVPRVISTTIMTALFDLFALFLGLVGGFAAGVFLTSSPSGYVASFYSQANISDDWGSVLKTAIFGLIIGLVCCYKGFRAKGGPAGVGKAVNQAVVISFALIWVVDYTFTNLLLGYAPSTQVIK